MKKHFYLLVLFLVLANLCHAQNNNKINYTASFELLRSTHSTLFTGAAIKAAYPIAKKLDLGFGVEFVGNNEHHDNGYVLTKLRFVPIYGNLKYDFGHGKIHPFVESSLGLSFNKYNIADETTPNNISLVNETGFYLYTGFGIKIPITKKIATLAGIGFKGYKMSLNEYDINPHGISFKVGFVF